MTTINMNRLNPATQYRCELLNKAEGIVESYMTFYGATIIKVNRSRSCLFSLRPVELQSEYEHRQHWERMMKYRAERLEIQQELELCGGKRWWQD